MVDPVTLSAISLIVVSVSSLLHFLTPAADWWRIRFKLHKVVSYECGSVEYEALWALLSHGDNVGHASVTRLERRFLHRQDAHPSWIITQVAKFTHPDAPLGYCFRITLGTDDAKRECIHFICFWGWEQKFFQHLLFEHNEAAAKFTLLGCSNK